MILFFLLHQVKQFMSRNKKLCVKYEIKVNLFNHVKLVKKDPLLSLDVQIDIRHFLSFEHNSIF